VKRIQILDADCPAGRTLAQLVEAAVQQLGLDARIELVSDMDVITSYQVMATPALVVDGEVRLVGRLPPVEEIRQLLQ